MKRVLDFIFSLVLHLSDPGAYRQNQLHDLYGQEQNENVGSLVYKFLGLPQQ